MEMQMSRGFPRRSGLRNFLFRRLLARVGLSLLFLSASSPLLAQGREDEIVANLAGGRVIVHVAKDIIIFAAIDQPVEANGVPPRVVAVDFNHIGVLFGASEWRIPADPKPIRMDRKFQRAGGRNPHEVVAEGEGEPDLETIGTSFLEELRPLVSQLHHKLDFSPDDPVFEVVLIGYAPDNYGPEVWDVEYRMEQEQMATRGEEYWQTRVLRPRFTQLYPPEKHAPHLLVETRYPPGLKGPTLEEMIKSNDPRITSLAQQPRVEKVLEQLRSGNAQKAPPADSVDYLRAVIPLIAGNSHFILGTLEDQEGLKWVVPPNEPIEKAQEDKNRPPEAPTLRRPIKPNP